MNDIEVSMENILQFEKYLKEEEKSKATTEKYVRDVRNFVAFLKSDSISKERIMEYKCYLSERYAATSVNSMLIALNSFLRFMGMQDCCVKLLKVQRKIFSDDVKELNKKEYQRLLKAADSMNNRRISLIIQTICGTGIRVSELQYITAEAVMEGKTFVSCKNKTRVIFIPEYVQNLLKQYADKNKIKSGPVFISKNGRALNRSNIWRDMKKLCEYADVPPTKVFPHNLRHLFARIFYSAERDIVRLADLLGHSSINTTRIYTMETGENHMRCLERIQKLLIT